MNDNQFSLINTNCFIINQQTCNFKLKKDQLNILNLNIQSIRNKLLSFEYFLNSFQTRFHAIVLTETWLNKYDEKFYNIDGYASFHNLRGVRRGGGCSIYIRSDLEAELIYKSSWDEIEFLIINIKSCGIKLCGIYRPPINTINKLDSFFNQFISINNQYRDIVVAGDININLLENDKKKCSL